MIILKAVPVRTAFFISDDSEDMKNFVNVVVPDLRRPRFQSYICYRSKLPIYEPN